MVGTFEKKKEKIVRHRITGRYPILTVSLPIIILLVFNIYIFFYLVLIAK